MTKENLPPTQITRNENRMKIDYKWAMPSAWTFTIKPIRELLLEEVTGDMNLWIDPFAGQNSPARNTNDLNPETPATNHIDAMEYLKHYENDLFDGILLDPPYSLRQVSEHYKKAGIKVTGWHTSAGWNSKLKDEAARIVKPGGKAICFGWSGMGLGKNRRFEMTRVLIVPHGGSKNATIVTVETKLPPNQEV